MENKELCHYGILGQRWGVRRYQNRDGTLTAKGKKRYAEDMEKLKNEEKKLKQKQRAQAKIEKLLNKQKELEEMKAALRDKAKQLNDESTHKTSSHKSESSTAVKVTRPKIDDLSDKELDTLVKRFENEKKYKTYMKELEKETEKVSKGRRFMEKVMKDAVIPAATEVGKKKLKDILYQIAGTEPEKKK